MEKLKYQIGDKEFVGTDKPSFLVASIFEQKVNELRAALYSQDVDPQAVQIDGKWIEDYFKWQDWLEIFEAHLKLVSEPKWVERYNPMGELTGKYLEDFFTYKDLREMSLEQADDIKKNLLQGLNYIKMQNSPLTSQVKLMKDLFETLKQNNPTG